MPLCDDNDPITLDVPTAEIKHPGQLHTEYPPAATGSEVKLLEVRMRVNRQVATNSGCTSFLHIPISLLST